MVHNGLCVGLSESVTVSTGQLYISNRTPVHLTVVAGGFRLSLDRIVSICDIPEQDRPRSWLITIEYNYLN